MFSLRGVASVDAGPYVVCTHKRVANAAGIAWGMDCTRLWSATVYSPDSGRVFLFTDHVGEVCDVREPG
jgi:hypothetical protein